MSQAVDRGLEHELNNQLGVVVSYAEFLLDELGSDSVHRGEIEAIGRAARRLMRLVETVATSEALGEDLRQQYASHLAIITRACDSVLTRLPAADPVAADVRDMLKATRAVAAIASDRDR